MEYKWDTAFAFGELQEEIRASNEESKRSIPRLPQQSKEQNEAYLTHSIRYNKPLEIQMNTLDAYGRVHPHIWTVFRGEMEDGHLLLGDFTIDSGDIRHIQWVDFQKWQVQIPKYKEDNPFEGEL